MDLSDRLREAIVWLGEPASGGHLVTDDILRQLASQGIIEYDPAAGQVKFTDFGAQIYRDIVGRSPRRNV